MPSAKSPEEIAKLKGKHSFLSPSKWHWINYDPEKLIQSYNNAMAAKRGTIQHAFAEQAILLEKRLVADGSTLSTYVNDAIKYKMIPEKQLYYSDYCFGTADALICRNGLLRIHDLKTGVTPAHMEQLMIYAALYCLQEAQDPYKLKGCELRIYQNDDVVICTPTGDEIKHFCDLIIKASSILEQYSAGVPVILDDGEFVEEF